MANLLGVLGRNEEAEQTYRLATRLHPEIAGGIEAFARFLESIDKQDVAASVRKYPTDHSTERVLSNTGHFVADLLRGLVN